MADNPPPGLGQPMDALLSAVNALGPWTWWIVGILLLGLEVALPGMFFLWFGLSAVAVGAIGLLISWTWQTQIVAWTWQAQVIAWVVLALLLLLAGRRWSHFSGESEDPALNQRTARYLGRIFVLPEPIVAGEGRLRIEDTIWRVSGPDLAAGTKVEVVGADGPVLRVRAARGG